MAPKTIIEHELVRNGLVKITDSDETPYLMDLAESSKKVISKVLALHAMYGLFEKISDLGEHLHPFSNGTYSSYAYSTEPGTGVFDIATGYGKPSVQVHAKTGVVIIRSFGTGAPVWIADADFYQVMNWMLSCCHPEDVSEYRTKNSTKFNQLVSDLKSLRKYF